jgi:predicted membrane-bound mannosyltransferase
MNDPKDLISIYRAAHSIEASLVKNLLADEGIEAVVTEANEPLAGLDITPPDVMVRVADEQRARAFIADYEEKLIEAAESGVNSDDELDEAESNDDEE